MKNIKKYSNWLSENNEHIGTLIGDSIKSIIDEWKEKPFGDYTLENGRVFINSQEGGNLLDKYKSLKLYLKNEYGIESDIRDIGWKTKSIALVFNPNQFVENTMN